MCLLKEWNIRNMYRHATLVLACGRNAAQDVLFICPLQYFLLTLFILSFLGELTFSHGKKRSHGQNSPDCV